jgi:glycosyltransferase involved in cell wall biosynthesis
VRALVESADALIAVSHDEGLGLPLLEAQYAGLPVIAADIPVFREVLAGSGALINPADAAASADRIAALAAEAGWRAREARASLANIERWLALARADRDAVIALIGALARSRGRRAC